MVNFARESGGDIHEVVLGYNFHVSYGWFQPIRE